MLRMQFVRRDRRRTWGAVSRGHERNALFSGPYMAGPAVTPAGNLNADLALRFGCFPGYERPRHLARFGAVGLWVGRDCREWFRLSDLDFTSLTFGSIALAWST